MNIAIEGGFQIHVNSEVAWSEPKDESTADANTEVKDEAKAEPQIEQQVAPKEGTSN